MREDQPTEASSSEPDASDAKISSNEDHNRENQSLIERIKELEAEVKKLKAQKVDSETTSQYRSLLDHVHSPITVFKLVFDDQGQPYDFVYTNVNQAYADWVGLPKEKIIGEEARKLFKDYRGESDWFQKMVEVATTGKPQQTKQSSFLHDKWLDINMHSPGENEVAMLVTDITKEKKAEDANQLSSTRLNLALEMERIAVWEWVIPSDTVENYNSYWQDLYEFDNKDTSQQFYERIFEADAGQAQEALEAHLSGKTEDFHQLYRLKNRHDEGFKWIRNSGKVVEQDAEGSPIRIVGVSTEITEQRLAELDLQLANTRLSMSLEMENLAIWEWDIPGDRTLNYNDHWKILYEVEPEGASGQFDARTLPEDKEELWRQINIGMQSDEPYTHEYRMWNKDHTSLKWIRNTGKVIGRDEYGVPQRVLSISKDITIEKERQMQLERSAFEQKYAQELSKMGNWYFDAETEKVEWTDQVYRIFGLDPNDPEVPYRDQSQYYEKESWRQLTEAVDMALQKGIPYDLELEVLPIDQKKSRWIRSIGVPVIGKEEKVIALRGVAHDITEIREVHQQLDKEKKFAETIMESSAAGIYIFNVQEKRNIYSNERTGEILGFSPEELREMTSETFIGRFHEEDLPEIFNHFEKINTSLKSARIKYRFRHKDGHYVSCLGVDAPYEFDEEGKLKSYIGSFIDVSELYQKEEELIRARNEAIAANKQKDLFLSNLSHEIRTPMNAVVGFSKLLRKSDKKKKEKDLYLEQIETNSKQLLVLIDDILDLTKIETGALQLNVENCSVKKLSEEVYTYYNNELQKADQGKALTIKFKPPIFHTELDLIAADPVRLKQVLTNLIDNAIKYSEEGTITFGYKYLVNEIQFSVSDEGIGIPNEKLDCIFERFEQLSKKQENTEGVGLGLSIVKGILDVMNGEISVSSEEGKGSNFTFTIPSNYDQLSVLENQGLNASTQDDIAIHKIMLADDTTSIHLYLNSLLAGVDVEIIHAYNGEEAIQLFKKNPDIGLILMDLKMPVINGEEAFYKIRELSDSVVIVAQSAFAMNDEISKYKSIGFSDYITKPIEEDKIMELLNAVNE